MVEATNKVQPQTINSHIQCTEKEQMIFDTLLEVVKQKNLNTTLRVAGGWVRDKVSLVIGLTEVDHGQAEQRH